jgi:hypothetical protein
MLRAAGPGRDRDETIAAQHTRIQPKDCIHPQCLNSYAQRGTT